MTALIGINHYYSIKRQALRNVLIYVPSIIVVKAGNKQLHWHDQTLNCNCSNWLIVPANQRLTFVNNPSISKQEQSQFRSTQMTFPVPPSKEMMDLITNTASGRSRPLLNTNSKLDFAFAQLQEMVDHNLTAEVQKHYLNGFYQQLLEAGVIHLLFPSSQVSIREQVSRYLAENPAGSHCIEDVCDHFAISKSTLSRRLAKENSSFREILTEVRMVHALGLMQERFHNQLDLAMRCGYQSEARFSQRFSLQFGITPKQYLKTLHSDCFRLQKEK